MGRNVSIPSWQEPHSLQMLSVVALFMCLELRETSFSPPTVSFEETLTIISSNQAKVTATFSVSSAEIVSHLCSTILGRNWDSALGPQLKGR